MPDILCPVVITCPGSDDPISNYSSEAPDVINFGAIGFPIFNPDNPLGDDPRDPFLPTYTAAGCNVVCFSNVSQQAANDCAIVDAYLCQNSGRRPPPDVPTIFYNDQQTCAFPCPDGSQFIWTVLAGTVVSGNQDLSNRIAAEIACARAAQFHLCLPTLNGACKDDPYSQTITVPTAASSVVFTITAGALPPGVTLAQTGPKTAVLSGTPTSAGTFPFTLTVQDINGNYISKTYNFEVVGITNTSLAAATIGAAYNQTLTAAGGTAPYTFAVEIGDLPPGLVLSDEGVISGTPTGPAGPSTFTLSVTDSGTAFCTKEMTINTAVASSLQICNWTTVLAGMTIPAGWAASVKPAWNGVFNLSTTFGASLPLYYFIDQSIGGKKVAASEAPDYPAGNWQNNDCFTQLFWTGFVWRLEFSTADNCADPNFLSYDGPTTLDNPAGEYLQTTAVGMTGPQVVVIMPVGTTCCPAVAEDMTFAPALPGAGPATVKVHNYNANLFLPYPTCSNCPGFVTLWNGVFDDNLGGGSYSFTFIAIEGRSRQLKGVSVQGDIHIRNFPNNLWVMRIFCTCTVGTPPGVWVGVKQHGATAAGTYLADRMNLSGFGGGNFPGSQDCFVLEP